MGARNSV
nr:truncated gag protein [Simian immunodeficiency virus]